MYLFNYRNWCKFDIYVEFWDIYYDIQYQDNSLFLMVFKILIVFLVVNFVYYVYLCCGLIYLFIVVGVFFDDFYLYF